MTSSTRRAPPRGSRSFDGEARSEDRKYRSVRPFARRVIVVLVHARSDLVDELAHAYFRRRPSLIAGAAALESRRRRRPGVVAPARIVFVERRRRRFLLDDVAAVDVAGAGRSDVPVDDLTIGNGDDDRRRRRRPLLRLFASVSEDEGTDSVDEKQADELHPDDEPRRVDVHLERRSVRCFRSF